MNILNNNDQTAFSILLRKEFEDPPNKKYSLELYTSLLPRSAYAINARDNAGQSLLHLALCAQRIDIAKLLLMTNGIQVNITNFIHDSALHLSALLTLPSCFQQLLIIYGADIGILNAQNQTALHVYLEKYEDVNMQDAKSLFCCILKDQQDSVKGNTVLHLAITKNLPYLVRFFLQKGVDVNIPNSSGYSALHISFRKGQMNIIDMILNGAANLDLNQVDSEGHDTVLHLAIKAEWKELIEKLIVKGADINVRNKFGNTPVHLAALNMRKCGRIAHEMVSQEGTNVDVVNRTGNTPLSLMLTMSDCPEDMLWLNKMIPRTHIHDVVGNKGNTLLHLAVLQGMPLLSQALAQKGANPDARNYLNKRPMDYAVFKRNFNSASVDTVISLLPTLESKHDSIVSQVFHNWPRYRTSLLPVIVKRNKPKHLNLHLEILGYGSLRLSFVCYFNGVAFNINPADLKRFLNILELICKSGRVFSPSRHMQELHCLPNLSEEYASAIFEMQSLLVRYAFHPRSLQHYCRVAIRNSLSVFSAQAFASLPLPREIQLFLSLENECVDVEE